MKKTIFILGLLITISFGATFEEAKIAYAKGDYQTSKTILEDLASKGDAQQLKIILDLCMTMEKA